MNRDQDKDITLLIGISRLSFRLRQREGGGVTQSLTPATNKPLKQKHGKKNSPHAIQKKQIYAHQSFEALSSTIIFHLMNSSDEWLWYS